MSPPFLIRIDDEEYAAQVPGDPEAVRLVSAGYLPLRPRVAAAGVHHRPTFAGSTLVIGEAHYEVIEEEVQGPTVVYRLRPWPADHIIRERVVYGAELIEAVREERRRLAQGQRGRRWLWPLYPFVGALPEPHQIRWCDRWGLDPVVATRVSGFAEAAAGLWLHHWVWTGGGVPSRLVIVSTAACWLLILSGLLRSLGGFIAADIAGAPIVSVFWRLMEIGRGAPAPDPTLLPMTRQAFWARLALPDHQAREPDGSLRVSSVLSHLTWTPGARMQGGEGHWWRVLSTDVALRHGRVLYSYRLGPETSEGLLASEVPPPPADSYQQTVLDEVGREWDDLRLSGFGVLISMLPAEVQERAVGTVGGPRALRRATAVSAALIVAGAVWMAFAPTVPNLVAAAAMAGESLLRILQLREGRYAPSVFGRWLARYLRPERVSYHAHRAAEWGVLRRTA